MQTVTDERNVFFYWRGSDYKLISLLRKLFYAHSNNGRGYNLIFLNDDNINQYIKDIPRFVYRMEPAIIADYLRVMVLCEYGGIWLDSDTLVMDSLDSLFDTLQEGKGFFIKCNKAGIVNGIFGTLKNTPLMKEWKKRIEEKMKNQRHKIAWNEIGSRMLQTIYDDNNSFYNDYKLFEGNETLYPITWNKCVKEFVNKPYDNYKNIVRDYQPVIILVNTVYKQLEKCESIEKLLQKDIPLNYFLNKSLENCGKKIDYLLD